MKHALLPSLLLFPLVTSCGDDTAAAADPSGGAQEAADAPGRVLAERVYRGEGVPGPTWIDGHVVGEGAPGTLQAQLDRSFEDFGARIEGGTLVIVLPGGQGTDFTLSRDTAQSAIPGAVALDLEPTAATVQTSGGGGLRDVDEGTVTISDCPRNRGDVVRGRLQAVVVASAEAAAGASWRMDLDFQVVVTSAAGELHCTSVGGTGGDEGGDEPPARCPNTLCEDLSFGCCPYSECLRDCEAITCNRIPCEGDEGGCRHSCLLGCVDQCGVTGTCVTTIQGLWDCQLDAGCFSGDLDGSEDACTRDRCCDAFTATF